VDNKNIQSDYEQHFGEKVYQGGHRSARRRAHPLDAVLDYEDLLNQSENMMSTCRAWACKRAVPYANPAMP